MIEEALAWTFGLVIVGMVLLLLYDVLFRPWRLVEAGLRDIEKQLELLDGRFARLYAFLIAPWLRGDVEKTKEFLRMMQHNKQRELMTYILIREG